MTIETRSSFKKKRKETPPDQHPDKKQKLTEPSERISSSKKPEPSSINVFLADGHSKTGKKIYERLERKGYTVEAPRPEDIDLSDPASVKAYLDGHNDRVDIIIYNAPSNTTNTNFENISSEEIKKTIYAHSVVPELLMQKFAPHMIENGGGKVLNIAPIRKEGEEEIVYSTAKQALLGVTESFAHKYGKHNILANQIDPDYDDDSGYETDMTDPENDLEKKAEDVAHWSTKLISGKNEFTTGAVLRVNRTSKDNESSRENLGQFSKTVLLTGASKGIGKEIHERLKKKGYTVFAPSSTDLDLSDHASIEAYFQAHKDKGIGIIINDAGINPGTEFEKMSPEEMEKIMRVNTIGAMLLTQKFLPYMEEKGWGRVVNIGSIWGMEGRGPRIGYSSSKFGLDGFTKYLARKLRKHNVIVNEINPGVIDTDMTRRNLKGQDLLDFLKHVPLNKVGQPKDIAYWVTKLISRKNNSMTGVSFPVDGGYIHRGN